MKIVFYAADKPREHMLAGALKLGARAHGDDLEVRRTADFGEVLDGPERKYPGPSPDTDVACCFGVKGRSREIYEMHRGMNIATLMFDKGYTRDKGDNGHTLYSRISVNAPDPSAYMMLTRRPDDRWKRIERNMPIPERRPHGHVLICSSSEKYHEFHRLPTPHEWAVNLVGKIKKLCGNQIIYRPKPSSTQNQFGIVDTDDPAELRAALEHYNAVMIRNKSVAGASFSNGASKIADALRGCHVVITHGSAASMDAVMAGVPVITLGGAVARPVAETDLDKIEKPHLPTEGARMAWLWAMSYCQWTVSELKSGEAWLQLKEEIIRQKAQSLR